MRVIIAGDRRFGHIRKRPIPTDEELKILQEARDFFTQEVERLTWEYIRKYGKITQIISGGANGIDNIGESLSKFFTNKKAMVVEADWFREGKRAGSMRNERMAKIADGSIILAAEDSKGSYHMFNTAKKQGHKIMIERYTWDMLNFMIHPRLQEILNAGRKED